MIAYYYLDYLNFDCVVLFTIALPLLLIVHSLINYANNERLAKSIDRSLLNIYKKYICDFYEDINVDSDSSSTKYDECFSNVNDDISDKDKDTDVDISDADKNDNAKDKDTDISDDDKDKDTDISDDDKDKESAIIEHDNKDISCISNQLQIKTIQAMLDQMMCTNKS